MTKPTLAWLPDADDFMPRIKTLEATASPAWNDLVALARTRLDFNKTERLSRLLLRHFGDAPPPGLPTKPIRLAILGSSTTVHLLAGLRVAALRRQILLSVHEAEYGQYLQELEEGDGPLARFRPDIILLALDARTATAGLDAGMGQAAADAVFEDALARLRQCWSRARDRFGATVIQQNFLPCLPTLMGSNEQRLPGSAAGLIERLNAALSHEAAQGRIHLLAVAQRAARDGITEWHDPVLWHRAKQEISPVAAPLYGDMVARIVAALQGRSAKCLVLDLDNTLWGGVIGDDGLEGITLGQGSALGEAFLSVQDYARNLARRGIILAVNSKNDEKNAFEAFDRHPEMLLKRSEISCFVANWDDKASNLRRIANELNIGTDSLVFLDDNPFERNLVRAALPETQVPEIPEDDPAMMAQILADAGYFEALALTDEDLARTSQYRANHERRALESAAADLPAYLRSLEMKLIWSPFDRIGLGRIVQLINKTNQFNLTTRRMTEDDVRAMIDDPSVIGLQLRLVDRFGDNGIIAIVIGKLDADQQCHIDTWLMSCRVLKRGVEEATLALLVEQAGRRGATSLVGLYIPTAKNGMVAGHYAHLGFTTQDAEPDGSIVARLPIASFAAAESAIEIVDGR